MRVIRIFISITLLSLTGLVFGQSQSFRCNFSEGLNTNFDSGRPSTKKSNDIGELVFDQLDPKKGTGRIVGNAGAGDVVVYNGNNSIHILEPTPSGNMNITTIFNPTKNSSGNFPVVHSRHINLPGSGPLPSQYVGLCKSLK
jgi:hypothetical protein